MLQIKFLFFKKINNFVFISSVLNQLYNDILKVETKGKSSVLLVFGIEGKVQFPLSDRSVKSRIHVYCHVRIELPVYV